jgi:hypothetical protein
MTRRGVNTAVGRTEKPGGRGGVPWSPGRAAQREGPMPWSVCSLHASKGPWMEPPGISRWDKRASLTALDVTFTSDISPMCG